MASTRRPSSIADGQDVVAAADRGRHERDRERVDRVVDEFDERDLGLGRAGSSELQLRHHAFVDETAH